MATLPQFQDNDRTFQMMQNTWSAILNPLIANPITQGQLLTGIEVTTGNNVINHKLGRALVGYIVVGVDAIVDLYQVTSQTPNLTLILWANNAATINLYVF